MTDAELIAALGWVPCRPHRTDVTLCDSHNEFFMDEKVCRRRAEDLDVARAGIDLARTGIGATLRADADRIDQEAKGSDAPGPLMVAATHQRRSAAMVEGWQP